MGSWSVFSQEKKMNDEKSGKLTKKDHSGNGLR